MELAMGVLVPFPSSPAECRGRVPESPTPNLARGTLRSRLSAVCISPPHRRSGPPPPAASLFSASDQNARLLHPDSSVGADPERARGGEGLACR